MIHGAATGKRGTYRWFESERGNLREVLEACPRLVVGHVVVVVACDSGPLDLTASELASGWVRQQSLAISPVVDSPSALPVEGWDEWYVFAFVPAVETIEQFVNFGGFSLQEDTVDAGTMDPTWDRRSAATSSESQAEARERFWTQLDRLEPDSYLASGDRLLCVTRRPELWDDLSAWRRRRP